jgi:hypothetical protein
VPRLSDFLGWVKGKAKVFFDVKFAHPQHLIDLIEATGMAGDCFLWSGSKEWMWLCHQLAPALPLKVNVSSPAGVLRAHEDLGARIVEVGPKHLSDDLIATCRQLDIRVMAYPSENSSAIFRNLLQWDIDLINLDRPDLFQQVLAEAQG